VADFEITRGSAADIAALEPLWVAVHHRHAESMPELGPYVSDAQTWEQQRAIYEDLLAKPGTLLLLARDDGALIGYAVAHVMGVRETWIYDTWETGERIGELEAIGVLPSHRGKGIGSALLDAVDREFAAQGVDDVILGVLPGNTDAMRLYARRGFTPTWLYMSRFAGRAR
jgi:ribosomal protein S18 acetylase RimI-like enzyme